MSPSSKDHPEDATENGIITNCDVDEVEEPRMSDPGYLSDSSTVEEFPLKRGLKRKEMCGEEADVKRVTANYQERQRMMKLNTALDSLRQCLPDQFKLGNRRISKIRTLRLAANYIKSLSDILKRDDTIRESLPPHPGFEPRLPTLTEVNRQGDNGELYTPEKELSLIPSPETLTYTPPGYNYPVYGHAHRGGHAHTRSSPHFQYNSHTTSSTLPPQATFPQLQPYISVYPPQFCPRGFPTQHLYMGDTILQQL